ncbi:MAG: response regulator [Candidatus Aminicenantes bacterium]|nr:response regulator [Candidatus Aminicenantes bacterium]
MIISDILMPRMDGFTLCRKVKKDENLKNTPFIFYTATYTDYKDEELAFKLGADKFIRKPMEPDEFIRVMQEVIKDAKKGKMSPGRPELKEEKDVFKLYSERLVRKLEKKIEELKSSEERLKILFEFAPDAYYINDLKGKIELKTEEGTEFEIVF